MEPKDNRFSFTEAKVRAMESPTKGRAWWYDAKVRGLCICKSHTGATSFYFYKWVNGRPARMLLGKYPDLTVDQARHAVETAIGSIADGKDPVEARRRKRDETTVGELWDHWQLYAKAHKRPSSIKEDVLKYNKFLKPWANRHLSTIKKSDVLALHSRVGRENGIYQANRLVALLRSMFNKADETGYRGENPARGVKLFKEQSRDRFLQPDELKAFFTALETEGDLVRDFYLTLLLTGARRSNVQTMRWHDVDLQAGYWKIPETKAGIPVIVPLVPFLVAILATRRELANGSEWVFPGQHGKHIANPKHSWDRILTAAKLTDLRPHDLRRSLGSRMAGQNVSLPIIGRALGHKTAQATMVYSRLSIDPIREAVGNATTAMLTAGGLIDAASERGGAE